MRLAQPVAQARDHEVVGLGSSRYARMRAICAIASTLLDAQVAQAGLMRRDSDAEPAGLGPRGAEQEFPSSAPPNSRTHVADTRTAASTRWSTSRHGDLYSAQ